MNQLEVAWAAGIVDGEGCITITKQLPGTGGRVNTAHRLYVKVSMGHRPTVEKLREIFDLGAITMRKATSPRENDAHTWWVSSRNARVVLEAIRPYLITKAEEADIGLEFLALPRFLTGGNGGNRPLTPETVAQREALFIRLRDAKPTARFRQPVLLT